MAARRKTARSPRQVPVKKRSGAAKPAARKAKRLGKEARRGRRAGDEEPKEGPSPRAALK
jgi:hypothetical protein